MTIDAVRQQGDQTIRSTVKRMVAAQQRWAGGHGVAHPRSVTASLALSAPTAALQPPHLVKDMLSQEVFYPAHDVRRESPAYAAVRKDLVEKQDRACLVCGVRHSTLTDPAQNLFGAKQIETHHRIVEWALSNAVDLGKFNARIVASFRRHAPSDATYDHDFSQQEMLDWIDHGADNLWVLCDVHHRHKYVGIHAISYPIWGPQDILEAGFGAQIPD